VGRVLLKRIAENLRSQNWGTVWVEFIVVVFGVFIGLQAQDWYEYRSERQAEREYIDRLDADFSVIHGEIEQCLSIYRQSIEAISEITQALEPRLASERSAWDSSGEMRGILLKATAGIPPPGRSATFVEMLSTGDLGLLRDNRLRRTLTAYDQRAQVNRETWRSLREIQDQYVAPLYENIRLAIDPDAQQIATVVAYNLSGLAADPRSRAMMNVLAGSKSNAYELCKIQGKRVADVQESLAEGT
jgi:hypothetical protein